MRMLAQTYLRLGLAALLALVLLTWPGIAPAADPVPPAVVSPGPQARLTTTGPVELTWQPVDGADGYQWQVHRVNGRAVDQGSTKATKATAKRPPGWFGQWAVRVRSRAGDIFGDWSPWRRFTTRWPPPPKWRGLAWWHETGPAWPGGHGHWRAVRRSSNVASLQYRTWLTRRAEAEAQFSRVVAEKWPEAHLFAETGRLKTGATGAVASLMTWVKAVVGRGINVRLWCLGDEPPFDCVSFKHRNWIYSELRRRLDQAGLGQIKLYYDFYPWPGWEQAINECGWPLADAFGCHAGYARPGRAGIKAINAMAGRWLKDRGHPDQPIVLTIQCFTPKGDRRPLTWASQQERLAGLFRLPTPGNRAGLLDQAIYRRLVLIRPFALGRAGDAELTAIKAPEVVDGYQRFLELYGLR